MDEKDDPPPFTLTVSAWPKIDPRPGNFHSAQCVLDTGCLQGNIISKKLAFELGFDESDYKRLDQKEKHGGKTATGHILEVEGALHLSWHYESSPQVLRDMRFLVLDANGIDMIIGARSIIKHKLLSPPNLHIGPGPSIVKVDATIDTEVAKLRSKFRKLENRKVNLEDKITEEKKAGNDVTEHEKSLEKIELDLRYRGLKIEKHNAEKKGETAVVQRVQKDIDDIEAKHKKSGKKKTKENSAGKKSSPQPNGPNVMVIQPDGKTRTATGDSQRQPKL
ncbi:uncharacterized protein K441DRAFT_659385 [Cenococcum geophilum 1.58]|uniref:uncharacterized protein n=1 Tax=Cenococcum geophilum 1.58 TaxID=794803 RepID=UPI00358E3620|nr:hypothetical protein K441DRAFT_659385 [Cenococcum geophilum 1.58]